jgi:hypothetical protein
MLPPYNLTSKPTPCANARPIQDQHPRHERKQEADAAEQRTRAAKTEPLVQLRGDEGEGAACWVDVSGFEGVNGARWRGNGDS